ncbi:NAD-dependent epimerase/dehydratase family protein [Planotetraspora phitsanulokensis]|uniref:dTDP-glucose 4,6-dehydratase n=1 Tax=Planotetraspora phitsanulokensis TaxID=575192 RepID=A0A8J3UNY0_9ACTN|nr:NAD(P)-dependent oxidoreductase [Planotetraspora phitsanulokensis]GII42090.1 dTDP-glucose 4,6-dehydratase [Planotetraspora phitsanulokensis]
MRVLVAGATGVIGNRMVPLLTAVGHDVVSLVRPGGAGRTLAKAGAEVVTADALDREGLRRAVREAAPDAVVNMLTAIPATIDPKRLSRDFTLTNRLRTEGTRNLVDAADGARIISQGLAYGYQPGEGLADEDAPLWRTGTPREFVPVLDALVELERLTARAGGLVLRLGHLYGPGSIYSADGSFTRQVRAGKVPLVGGGHAVFSFTHADDVAAAVAAALDKDDVTGVLNVVDDRPAPLHEWLPAFTGILGVRAPKRAPAALARLAVGSWGVAFMNELRGADNARARLRLDWRPRYASVLEGFAADLAAEAAGS